MESPSSLRRSEVLIAPISLMTWVRVGTRVQSKASGLRGSMGTQILPVKRTWRGLMSEIFILTSLGMDTPWRLEQMVNSSGHIRIDTRIEIGQD